MKPLAEPADTILEEIHETRRRLLQEHGGIRGLASFLREQEAKANREIRAPGPITEPDQAMRRSGRPVG